MIEKLINLAETRFLPDFMVRYGINFFLRQKLKIEKNKFGYDLKSRKNEWVEEMKNSPIASFTEIANEQHYEVPPEFFKQSLGPNLKYSCAYWDAKINNLSDAEERMFEIYIERSEIKNGMSILDLGCGWGSFSLYLAKKFPESKIIAVSNSNDQGEHINSEIKNYQLNNIHYIKMNMKDFKIDKTFDRIVSIEMFEHMRNYEILLHKISKLLKTEGKLFLHFFCHDKYVYPYEVKSNSDWMTKYFFYGGMMPSFDILSFFENDLKVIKSWKVNGNHYKKTCRSWLENQDKNKNKIMTIFKKCYDKDALIWFNRWRIFWMSCEELFGYKNGSEWYVGHFLMSRKKQNEIN